MQTEQPLVSFVVPCYNLGHLLRQCILSISNQSYRNIEIIIMDDCSPDNTPDVAASIGDNRVIHVRNTNNLGHLRNYNKGIELARGKYVWLISADDRLRVPYAVERYVRVMEERTDVGYIFCPGVGLKDGAETGLLKNYYYGDSDQIFDGREFIVMVLEEGGGLLSPSVMVRKCCYQDISAFPLDMPHQGDMYLWFLWALEYNVAYLSEPMVNYRSHDLNMMKDLTARVPQIVFNDEVNVLWRIKDAAKNRGFDRIARQIEEFISGKYAHAVGVNTYREACVSWGMTISECEQALRRNATDNTEYRRLRARFHVLVGDKHWLHAASRAARRSYCIALRADWRMPRVWIKVALASIGRGARPLRRAAKSVYLVAKEFTERHRILSPRIPGQAFARPTFQRNSEKDSGVAEVQR